VGKVKLGSQKWHIRLIFKEYFIMAMIFIIKDGNISYRENLGSSIKPVGKLDGTNDIKLSFLCDCTISIARNYITIDNNNITLNGAYDRLEISDTPGRESRYFYLMIVSGSQRFSTMLPWGINTPHAHTGYPLLDQFLGIKPLPQDDDDLVDDLIEEDLTEDTADDFL